MSTVARPTFAGPVMLDDVTDLVALLGGQITKPSGDEYLNTMTGPGAWPEFDESVFDQRKELLSGIKSTVSEARGAWDAVHAEIFNGLLVWVGRSASAAAGKAEQHSQAMQEIENQLAAAIEWCANAWFTTRNAKKAIADFVWLTHNAITDLLNKDYEKEADKKDAENAAKEMAEQAYLANKQFLDNLAASLSGKTEENGSPPSETHAAAPLDNGTEGSGSAPSFGSTSGSGGSSPANTPTQEKSGSDDSSSAEDVAPGTDRASLFAKGEDKLPETPAAVQDVAPGTEKVTLPAKGETLPDAPAAVQDVAPGTEKVTLPTKAETLPDAPTTVLPSPTQQQTPGRQSPTSPAAPSVPSVPSAPSAPSASPLSSAASSLSSSGSPASSAASAGAGIDPSKAAGQAPVGGAPTDPLQAFSKGFADSAGTPVHAASSGGAPPPLAPSPAVPASDAMTPASTAAPVSQAGTPAPTAPVQAPASGGAMGGGMGMGGMPLGPPPTAPPAAPVAPPPAAPPPATAPPGSVAGGAQVAPIPVSAARAERDAAQNAAKRSGSDPLEVARRIAAALNAPGMVNSADYKFFWITGLTADGKIVVANNYGLAYIPEQVHLPDQVNMASADESIAPAERASWVNEPIVAVQRWAQHHDTELRAVIATEAQLQNSDAGVHHEVLSPEDIPASGKMAGRDRLQVIAPQVSSQLARISDVDLVKVLPPAPTDVNPPEDRRTELWDKVWKPLASRASNRGERHLRAFVDYSAHAQEQAVYAAHTAAESEDQRRAVHDFIYWQHVGQLIADAIAE